MHIKALITWKKQLFGAYLRHEMECEVFIGLVGLEADLR